MDSLIATFHSLYSTLTQVVSQETIIIITVLSVLMFVGTLVAIPIILSRLPSNYFQHDLEHVWMEGYHPAFRTLGLFVKNSVGIMFLLAGIAMLVLPGQGILTIVIGISLLDFPGKRKLEHKLLTQPMVFQAMNAIRQKFGRPPLESPSEARQSVVREP